MSCWLNNSRNTSLHTPNTKNFTCFFKIFFSEPRHSDAAPKKASHDGTRLAFANWNPSSWQHENANTPCKFVKDLNCRFVHKNCILYKNPCIFFAESAESAIVFDEIVLTTFASNPTLSRESRKKKGTLHISAESYVKKNTWGNFLTNISKYHGRSS